MRAFLLTAAALMSCAGSIFAQVNIYSPNLPPDYSWELGLNYGISAITRPLGPAETYQGARTDLVPQYSFRFNYFASEHWMLNLDIGESKWETYGTWQLTDLMGQKLNGREVAFLEANHAFTESVGLSYVIPFYNQYHTLNRSNLNFGVLVGLVTTVNDGSIGYSTYNASPDSGYVYASKYDYGYGIGYTLGVQVGYTYYITPRLALNADLSVRYEHVNTSDSRYSSENDKFYLLYFPETIGIRWRF